MNTEETKQLLRDTTALFQVAVNFARRHNVDIDICDQTLSFWKKDNEGLLHNAMVVASIYEPYGIPR